MLGWLLLGAIIACAIVITVDYLTEDKAKEELKNNNFLKAVVKSRENNVVKMSAFDECGKETEVEFHVSEGVSSEIQEGKVIKIREE
jgi:uncharacterized protein YxeA